MLAACHIVRFVLLLSQLLGVVLGPIVLCQRADGAPCVTFAVEPCCPGESPDDAPLPPPSGCDESCLDTPVSTGDRAVRPTSPEGHDLIALSLYPVAASSLILPPPAPPVLRPGDTAWWPPWPAAALDSVILLC